MLFPILLSFSLTPSLGSLYEHDRIDSELPEKLLYKVEEKKRCNLLVNLPLLMYIMPPTPPLLKLQTAEIYGIKSHQDIGITSKPESSF